MNKRSAAPLTTEDLARGVATAALSPALLAIILGGLMGGGYGFAAGLLAAAYLLPISLAFSVLALAPLGILLKIRRLTLGPILCVSVAVGLLAGWVFRGVDWEDPPVMIGMGGVCGIVFGLSLWALIKPDTPAADRAATGEGNPE